MDYKSDVIKWLKFYGYNVTTEDEDVLEFIIERVTNYILAQINQRKIPDGLYQVAVDMVVGEFLQRKKSTGSLEGFDLDGAISSIKEGDTTVDFGDSSVSDEQRLDALISALRSPPNAIWARYRKVVW